MGRTGSLDLTKECSEYKGMAGDHCTITVSNVDGIEPGAQVVYASGAGEGSLDSDIVLEAGEGSSARGHVNLDLGGGTGTITFSGGTGKLAGFEATAAVSADAEGLWHWHGTYSFSEMDSPVATGA
jgi:hypothetical protein